jgi:predicted aspartyl protease
VTRYNYNSQLQPPAPFVHVVVRNPADGSELQGIPAQIDTGADQTVLPETVVQGLQLPRMGTMLVGGFAGTTITLPTYAVLLGIHDRPLQPVKVVASAEEKWVLLGRDVLNSFRIVVDGPQLVLEIE